MRDILDLELAYQVARNTKRFSRGPMYHRPEAPGASAPNQPSGPSQIRPNRPNNNTPWTHRDDRGKAPVQQNLNPNACFKCHQVGHYASNCLSRALYMEELEGNEAEPIAPLDDCVEKVYQAEDNLADEYEDDEDYVDLDFLGVVRCILT